MGDGSDRLAEGFFRRSSFSQTSSIHVEVNTLPVAVQEILFGQGKWTLQRQPYNRRNRPALSELHKRRVSRDSMLRAKGVYPSLLRRQDSRAVSSLAGARARGRECIGKHIIRASPSSGSYDTNHILVTEVGALAGRSEDK